VLAFLPIIGPIIQGIISIFTKVEDTKVEILKTTQGTQIEESKISAQIIASTQDDLGLRLMRDLYCFPAVVQVALTGWDTMIALNSWHVYMWHVATFPPSLEWYPYSVAVFLLGNIGINMWNRRR
jgi:hypothetical protein